MKEGSNRLAILLGLAFVVSQANLGYVLGPLSPNIIAVQLTFDAGEFWKAMALWGPVGMDRLKATLLPWDMLHPFIYGALGHVLVTRTRLFRLPPHWRPGLAWALPLAGACDLLENLLELYVLSRPFGTDTLAIPFSASFSSIKLAIATGFALLVLSAVAARLLERK